MAKTIASGLFLATTYAAEEGPWGNTGALGKKIVTGAQ